MKRHSTVFRQLVLTTLLILAGFSSTLAQNVSTEGTDFWLSFMPHNGSGGVELSIFISTSQDTVTGTISVPGLGVINNFTLGANSSSAIEYRIPPSFEDDVISIQNNTVDNKSIHIVTDNPISAYALNNATNGVSADATILLPTVTLGKQYYGVSHNQDSFLPSYVSVIGVVDGTEIELVPSQDILNASGFPIPNSRGDTISITLDEGETYLIQSNGDLTGTSVFTKNSSTGDCKNFAAFSGTNRTRVGCNLPGYDHLFQQLYPVKTWGQNYTFLPLQDRNGGDLVKIIAFQDNTTLNVSGQSPVTMSAGDLVVYTLAGVRTIEASKPISVTQFSRSAGCDFNNPSDDFGDPFMIALSPNEQLLREITFTAFDIFPSFTYYVDIVSPTAGASSVSLADANGNPIALTFTPLSNGMSYSQVELSVTGVHQITSDSGFIANVYGFGSGASRYESYGYTTGASLNNLNFTVSSIDSGQLLPSDTESLCLGNSIDFSPQIDTVFKFFEWDMGDGTTYSDEDVSHTYNTPGIYNVSVTAFTALGDCANEQTAVKTIEVIKSDFGIRGPLSVCPNTNDIEYIAFEPKGEYTYTWSVVGGTLSSGAGTDTIGISWGAPNSNASIEGIAVDDLGCDDTTQVDVVINNVLEPSSPIGPDSICYADLTQKYEALLANGNAYEFFVEGGTLTEDTSNPNGNTIFVTWDTTAKDRKLWFKEFNLADTICAGISDTFFVATILPEIKQATLAGTDVSCFGETDGTVSYTAQGGVGTLSYVFNDETDTVTTGINKTGLAAGTYDLHVIDETGCSISPQVVITEPDSLTITPTVTDVVCHGDATGSIDLDVIGGTPSYTYTWSSSAIGDTSLAENLTVGQYQVRVEDSRGCTKITPFIDVTQPDKMAFTINGPDSICQLSSDKLYVISDDDDDDYTWFVEGGTITSGQNTDSIRVEWGVAGTGEVKAISQNAFGCVSDTMRFDIKIFAYPQPVAATGADSLCFVDTLDIRYQVTHTAGRGYNWFVDGGTLTVDVAAVDGNEVDVDWASSGTHKIWYEEYLLDEPICAAYSDTLEVSVLTELVSTNVMNQVSCFGGNNGTIITIPNGSTTNYTYSWPHDPALTDSIATDLTAGNYSVTIEDRFGCNSEFTIEVTEPTVMQLDSVFQQNVTCFNGTDGELQISVTGGVTPYTIQWDDAAMQSTETAINLAAGTYKVLVADDSLCKDSLTFEVTEPNRIEFGIEGPEEACQLTTGHEYNVDIDSNYTYTWTIEGDGTIISGQGTKNIMLDWGVSGDYTLKVVAENALGCVSDEFTKDVAVFVYPQPDAPTGADSICRFDTDVKAYQAALKPNRGYVWFVEGGTLLGPTSADGSMVQIVWDDPVADRKVWYREYLLNDDECGTLSDTLEITVLSESFGEIGMTPVSCKGDSNGTVFVIKSGGIGSYTYEWEHAPTLTDSVATGLSALNSPYEVTITDEYGCSNSLSIDVTQPDELLEISGISLDHVECHGDSAGTIVTEVNGGILPYNITWDDPKNQTTETAIDLPAGTYMMIVTDSTNCADTATYTIIEPEAFSVTILDTVPSSCKIPEGSARIVPQGATSPFTYHWTTTNDFNGNTASNIPAGDNLVEVTDGNGCEYDVNVYINSKDPEIYFPTAFSPNGDGLNDEYQMIFTCDGTVSFTVYNRWGDVIHQSNDTDPKWDGTSGGQVMPIGVYTYRLNYEVTLDGVLHKIERNGSIMLIR